MIKVQDVEVTRKGPLLTEWEVTLHALGSRTGTEEKEMTTGSRKVRSEPVIFVDIEVKRNHTKPQAQKKISSAVLYGSARRVKFWKESFTRILYLPRSSPFSLECS